MREFLLQFMGEEAAMGVQFMVALLLVLLLFGIFVWFLRLVTGKGRRKVISQDHRLAVLDRTQIDDTRSLLLIRRDDVEHLVMIGGPSDVVVEANINQYGDDNDRISEQPLPGHEIARRVIAQRPLRTMSLSGSAATVAESIGLAAASRPEVSLAPPPPASIVDTDEPSVRTAEVQPDILIELHPVEEEHPVVIPPEPQPPTVLATPEPPQAAPQTYVAPVAPQPVPAAPTVAAVAPIVAAAPVAAVPVVAAIPVAAVPVAEAPVAEAPAVEPAPQPTPQPVATPQPAPQPVASQQPVLAPVAAPVAAAPAASPVLAPVMAPAPAPQPAPPQPAPQPAPVISVAKPVVARLAPQPAPAPQPVPAQAAPQQVQPAPATQARDLSAEMENALMQELEQPPANLSRANHVVRQERPAISVPATNEVAAPTVTAPTVTATRQAAPAKHQDVDLSAGLAEAMGLEPEAPAEPQYSAQQRAQDDMALEDAIAGMLIDDQPQNGPSDRAESSVHSTPESVPAGSERPVDTTRPGRVDDEMSRLLQELAIPSRA